MSDGFMISQYRHWKGPASQLPAAYRPVQLAFGAPAAAPVQTASLNSQTPAATLAAKIAEAPVTPDKATTTPAHRAARPTSGAIAAAPTKVVEPPLGGPPVDLTADQFAALVANSNPLAPPGTASEDIAARMQRGLDKYQALTAADQLKSP